MFLSKSKVIIALKDNQLEAFKISFRTEPPVVEKRIEKEFTPETLAGIFSQVKEELKINSARLLLPENKAYLRLLKLPREAALTRDLIWEKAQEVIPETLEDGYPQKTSSAYFDWKQVGADQKSFKVQVLAVAKTYLTPILQAARNANLTFEALEPASFALARLTTGEKEPHLIFYQNRERIICAAHQGQVLGTVTVDNEAQMENKARELIDYIQKEWGVEIKKTVKASLDPAISLALKQDIKDKDEEVLNLTPEKTAA